MKSFTDRVLGVVLKIPKGSVMTYGQVAKAAGSPGSARVVGNIMKANHREDVPCHRVIRSDGKIGDYNRGGQKAKENILKKEGYLK